MVRPINAIAAEISTVIRGSKTSSWMVFARPYISAMLDIRKVTDMYGIDPADDIVRRFLSNAQPWRGDDARRLKAELNEALKEANVHN
jgi:hypothetical protein